MAEHIPEDVMVQILQRLPIKSLIRFTCVSKRWRFIVLSDHQFAKSQFQITSEQSRTRLLLSTSSESEFESLDTETQLDPQIMNFSVRKLSCPFKQPDDVVRILSSCNGLVCASALYNKEYLNPSNLHIWNPSTGFFQKLPDSLNMQSLCYFGFGYLSATGDYKVIVKIELADLRKKEAEIFSWRANTWKTIQVPYGLPFFGEGFLLNEALHWFKFKGLYTVDIVAFDLAKEEFRRIPLHTTLDRQPRGQCNVFAPYGVAPSSFRGCLCTFDHANVSSIELWVMTEYDVADSWTKLFNIKLINPPTYVYSLRPILVTETCIFLKSVLFIAGGGTESKLIRVFHDEEKLETYMVSSGADVRLRDMITFEESLLWLH
ncbi:F-box/kelch-repeat protein At3g23880-like [Rosa rugosa]|uniref:F-box/kelch-repeat protein At3g23880-like n=1 Tax=Rosa rugosa TaxID=74645 RepID=UPI002B40300C|nr:F-box/kelch-repeat protein At3g23880-like [Rosa rugosa]